MIDFDATRVRNLNSIPLKSAEVIYWMSRDQRVNDNWSLLYAQKKAFELKSKLTVIFYLQRNFLNANNNHFGFMLQGLEIIRQELKKTNINLIVFESKNGLNLSDFFIERQIGLLIADFSPLKIHRKWLSEIKSKASFAIQQVDSHNIVPCWLASDKQEFSARTFRPKIHRQLNQYLTDFPKVKIMPSSNYEFDLEDEKKWQNLLQMQRGKTDVAQSLSQKSGEKFAHQAMDHFLQHKIFKYDQDRNNPTIDGQSNLSPYLHFGQLSAQRLALETQLNPVFFEELVVRRELAENYCFYNSNYDNFEGFPEWSKKSLTHHLKDKRQYLYSLEELELGLTHDQAWNYFQKQMIKFGKMHGYMRMYWAKKILEWTETPQKAQEIAIYLNDKYQLDGRDPNGYVGIAWAIGGVHDRPWAEREIFGLVRYMNYQGLERRFKISKFLDKLFLSL